ncbi:MAG: hypothetical protein KA099_07815 [Alphaproteobacteria bacterium]|nr:hypothetical protein [Alphaproteobacteria bacterium]MBP7763047.1 hypothetical protein [Alphaproteobacteria bacterium]MBP7905215.1 hypothetical protein [Alphaproteobacteria bacterium]
MLKKVAILLVCLVFTSFSLGVQAEDTKVYDVPLTKILDVIEKTKGTRRVVLIWRSKDKKASRKLLAEFSDLENTVPDSIISISDDTDPLALRGYLKTIPILPFKVLRAQKKTGQNINLVLRKLGAEPVKGYPAILLLNEDNTINAQGRIYIDYAVDFIVSQN